MKTIRVYDEDAKLIEKVADANDLLEHEVIEMLCEYLPTMVEENDMKM